MADYDIKVTRQARVLGSDATLMTLMTSPDLFNAELFTIDPTNFKPDVISYTVTVASSVHTITVTATPTDTDTDDRRRRSDRWCRDGQGVVG